MTRRAAIAALAVAFAAFAQARGEWVTEVVTNRVEYDGVEWLEDSGDQYINTEIVPSVDWEIDIGLSVMSSSSGNITILGCRESWNARAFYLASWTSPMSFAFAIGSSGAYPSAGTINIILGEYLQLRFSRNYIYKNGVKMYDAVDIGDTRPELEFYIFAGNNNGAALKRGIKRIMYFNAVCRDTKILNLIPVLDGTTPKMLNLVDWRLFANAGTGAFTYGAVTGKVAGATITTNRVYRAPAPMRSFDAAHPFNAPTARTRLGGTGNGEDGTTLRPSAHFDIKKNEEE